MKHLILISFSAAILFLGYKQYKQQKEFGELADVVNEYEELTAEFIEFMETTEKTLSDLAQSIAVAHIKIEGGNMLLSNFKKSLPN